jgi:hypothetical protein
MILRGEILDGEVVTITVVNNKIHVQPNHEVMYDADEDMEDMDLDVEDLE